MIRIENLRKEYDAKTVALDDIDLVFEDSTFVALLGPSGCGKTTTLNCIAGLLEPTSGKIFFGDKDVTQLQPKDRNIGMVFQSYALYPRCCKSSICSTASRPSFPAASSSAFPWRARWSRSRTCCCSTNR